jgi:hypothetical protein
MRSCRVGNGDGHGVWVGLGFDWLIPDLFTGLLLGHDVL